MRNSVQSKIGQNRFFQYRIKSTILLTFWTDFFNFISTLSISFVYVDIEMSVRGGYNPHIKDILIVNFKLASLVICFIFLSFNKDTVFNGRN